MLVTWDATKNASNKRKHGVSFEVARLVFDDPDHLSIQDRIVAGEERWQTFGLVSGVIVLMVAHTYLDDNGEEAVRIISARKATRRERESYESQIS